MAAHNDDTSVLIFKDDNENLLINEKDHVLVKHHWGKLGKDGKRKAIRPQKNIECAISSRKRLLHYSYSYHDSLSEIEKNKRKQGDVILKKVKLVLEKYPVDFTQLHEVSSKVLYDLGEDPVGEIINSEYLQYLSITIGCSKKECYDKMNTRSKAIAAYLTVLDRVDSLLGLKTAAWSPKSGVEGLMRTLKKNKILLFCGKFGVFFHLADGVVKSSTEHNRNYHFFKRNTLRRSQWTHCVLVDEVKKVSGKYFIFFSDSSDPSKPEASNNVYGLSYDSFVERLTNRYGLPDTLDHSYGIYKP